MKSGILVEISQATITGETVEKVPEQILGGDAEKNDLTECATINDLTIMKGRETPKNRALTILKGFSTVSEVIAGPVCRCRKIKFRFSQIKYPYNKFSNLNSHFTLTTIHPLDRQHRCLPCPSWSYLSPL